MFAVTTALLFRTRWSRLPRKPARLSSTRPPTVSLAGGRNRSERFPSDSAKKGTSSAGKRKDGAKATRQFKSGLGFAKPSNEGQARPLLRPGTVSPRRTVPAHIQRPSYVETGHPPRSSRLFPRMPWDIEVKTPEQIERMRKAGRIAREVLDIACQAVHVGMTTDEIDAIVHEETIRRDAYPSPLNYSGFPKSCCTSINEVICHGIPDSTRLRDGDIINIDVTCYVDGVHGDCSEMVLVGNVDEAGRKLVKVTFECLEKAIRICRPGTDYSTIGAVIEEHATQHGFGVARDFLGHGIGHEFHDMPNILHFRNREPYGRMKVGHTFTIEPMLHETMNTRYRVWSDGWTAVTEDGARSAQYEHTLLIVEDGVEILTQKTPDSFPYFWEKNGTPGASP
ncbi:hypothetical protein CCYA_CCYA01G0192 [Cyanidiococcus yangmingshanensis]|nr:hypothetical protein CCYA_CCYA01G0192 [Cyanidiococcus yangmingshanensis]